MQSVPSARQAVREAIPPRGENTWVKATASDVPGPAERDETIRATHFDNFLRMELGRLDRTIWNVVHNIAHRDTFGYKAFRFEFPEALPRFSADSERITLPESAGEVPALVDMSRGKTVETKQMLDIVIEGEGFLTAIDSRGNNPIYTRCGRLTVNPNGCLAFPTPWLSLNEDYYSELLDPSVVVPEGTVGIQIAQKGTVWARDASGNQTDCGAIHIVTFAKPHRLRPIDERFFEATRDSGEPVALNIDAKAFPVIRQGFLEASNVDPDAQKSELQRLLEQRESLRKLITP
ncbi:MAG TPA: hypothetical protein DEB39_08085 [Planctomycetaceae bacterium]|nr:hypothetical protein [Planctomycetaceae bacterium]